MKNRLYLLAFLLFNAFFAHAQKTPADNFTLRGTIYNSHTNKLWLRYPDSTGNVVNRLIHVKNGKFIFKAFLISPVYAGLVISPELHIEGTPGFAELFLNPGNMTITMYEGHFNEAKITGESEMRNEWEQLMKQKKPLQDAKYSLYEKQWKISAGGNTPKNHAAAIINGDKIDVYSYREKQMDYNFILSHHTSYLSPYLTEYYFASRELPLDSAKMFYNSFSHLVKTSLDGRWLKKELTDRSIAAVGSMAPPFIEKDIDGKMLDIRSFRNKNYVILYLWTSWSVRPDGESPHLKQLYAKYHAKGLEVVSLSLDFFVKDWKDAIKKHGMVKWHHVWVNQIERLHSIYDIEGMPPSFLILIDKNSKIIGRYIDENGMKFKIDNGDSEGTLADLDKKLQQVMPGK